MIRKHRKADTSNVEQLRRDIDSGRTASKVPANDPAAVPLGADDEAGGVPPDPAIVEVVRRNERRAAGERDPVAAVGRHGPRAASRLSWGLGIAAVAIALLVAAYALAV